MHFCCGRIGVSPKTWSFCVIEGRKAGGCAGCGGEGDRRAPEQYLCLLSSCNAVVIQEQYKPLNSEMPSSYSISVRLPAQTEAGSKAI